MLFATIGLIGCRSARLNLPVLPPSASVPAAESVSGKTAAAPAIATPDASSASGLLRITVADLNGKPVRATIAFSHGITYGYRLFRQIPAGVYRIEVMAIGYRSQVKTVVLQAGQILNQTFRLEPDRAQTPVY